jgi:hypothetical protein
LNENLISGAQLSRQADLEKTGMSRELTEATIRRSIQQAEKIDFNRALDHSRHLKDWMVLLIGLALWGMLVLGIMKTEFLRTWFSRNVLLSSAQWPQRTYLEIVGEVEGRMMLPRGTDHRQLVHITADSYDQNVELFLEVETANGRTTHGMKPTGRLDGREHLFVFHNVSSEFRFRASGGDDVTEWVQVGLVEPPAVVNLKLEALLPGYTGIPRIPLEGSGPHSVLFGSQLGIAVQTNKPVTRAELLLGEQIFPMNAVDSAETQFELLIPPAEDSAGVQGGQYEIVLVDQTGLKNTRTSKFTIKVKEDQPPKVRATLLGISGLAVPRGMVPVSYHAVDEYGLIELSHDAHWKSSDSAGDAGEQLVTASRMIPILKLDSAANVRDSKDVHVLDLQPLDLKAGTSFRFSVVAVDNRPNQPNSGRSNEFLLRIVTEDELRGDLLRREIEQRQAFQQAYDAQLEVTSELQAIAAMRDETGQPEKFSADRQNRLAGLYRDQKVIGTRITSVADRFEEFLVEAKNNRLDENDQAIAPEKRLETRFDQGIIQPIRELDAQFIALATRHLDNCRRLAANANEFPPAVQQTVAIQQEILERMKRVLDAMVDSENFQEIVNKLVEIKRNEERLKNEIEKRSQPRSDIFEPDGTDKIFEDD